MKEVKRVNPLNIKDSNKKNNNEITVKSLVDRKSTCKIIGSIISLVGKELFRTIDKSIKEPKNLDELAQEYSKSADKIMLEGIDEGLEFLGGRFKISKLHNDQSRIEVSIEAYFQENAMKWIKKDNSIVISSTKITQEAYKELSLNKVVEYELEMPNSKIFY